MATLSSRMPETFDSTDVLARLAPFAQVVQKRVQSRSVQPEGGDSCAENIARRRSARWASKDMQSNLKDSTPSTINGSPVMLWPDRSVEIKQYENSQKLEHSIHQMEKVVQEALNLANEQIEHSSLTPADIPRRSFPKLEHSLRPHRSASEPLKATGSKSAPLHNFSDTSAKEAPFITPRASSRLRKHTDRPTQQVQDVKKLQSLNAGLPDHHSNRFTEVGDNLDGDNEVEHVDLSRMSDCQTEGPDRTVKASSGYYDLRNRRHIDVEKGANVTFSRTHKRAPIARDWRTGKKRFVAIVQCINTALIGLIIGIYAGEVPAIQYYIVDQSHYTVLGNVLFLSGCALPLMFFYTLPTLHGRKPYTLGALAVLMPLMFPQALAVQYQRSPFTSDYRLLLLLPRALAGLAAGFVEMNLMTTLLDLFGASLQSSNPHQEIADPNDVRRHGGGMGVWLSIWTWCAIGSIGFGFFIGACIISSTDPAWGFWISIVFSAAVLILNVVAPETRRSPYRRSVAEVRTGSEVFRRFGKGEFMMHLYQVGPSHWWEEVVAGWILVIKMLSQPGFLMLSLYQGWVYAEVVMVMIVLGNLTSVEYQLHPALVGLCVLSLPLGAALAIPFQKASLFSRSRSAPPRTDSMTFEKRLTWTSHLVRRGVFMITLPLFTMAYTISSTGSGINIAAPITLAVGVGFLSNLALSEVFGIIMETFDTSDLQPGMTGRLRKVLPDSVKGKRTNFSCFPRVTAAFMIVQGFAFLISAAATGVGGVVTHHVGAQKATGIVCGVLFGLSLLLILALTRIKTLQVVPKQRYATGELSGPEDEWKPVIIGHPSGTTRRVSLLELGTMTRWTEIRRKNKVFDTPSVSVGGSRRLNRDADRAGD